MSEYAGARDQPISRDALIAELAKMELRLVEKLAPISRVQALEDRVLSRDAIKELIGDSLRDSEARGWSARERIMGLVLFLITAVSFVLNIYSLRGHK